jgi:hypothetical protein
MGQTSCYCFLKKYPERHVSSLISSREQMVTPLTVVISVPTKGGLGAQTGIDVAQGKPDKILLLGRTKSKVTPTIEEISALQPKSTSSHST